MFCPPPKIKLKVSKQKSKSDEDVPKVGRANPMKGGGSQKVGIVNQMKRGEIKSGYSKSDGRGLAKVGMVFSSVSGFAPRAGIVVGRGFPVWGGGFWGGFPVTPPDGFYELTCS